MAFLSLVLAGQVERLQGRDRQLGELLADAADALQVPAVCYLPLAASSLLLAAILSKLTSLVPTLLLFPIP